MMVQKFLQEQTFQLPGVATESLSYSGATVNSGVAAVGKYIDAITLEDARMDRVDWQVTIICPTDRSMLQS